LSASDPASYQAFKDRVDFLKLDVDDLEHFRGALVSLKPEELVEAQGKLLDLLKEKLVWFDAADSGIGGASVHNPCMDKLKHMTSHKVMVPIQGAESSSFLVICSPRCLW
jgi:hypothetical protein